MSNNFEMAIYGGRFRFSPPEVCYGVYEQTISKALGSYNDDWAECAIKRLMRESCIDVVRDELNKLQAAIKDAAGVFVKLAKPDVEVRACMDAVYTRLMDGLIGDIKQRLNSAYASIPRNASLDEVAEEGRRAFAQVILEISVLAEQMNNLMREELEENGVIAKPKKKKHVDGQAIFDELMEGIDNPPEKAKKKLAALNAMPQNEELIAWCWADDNDKGPIKELAKGVGVSLKKVEDMAFRELAGPCDLSTEKKALAYRKMAEKAAKQIDYYKGKDVLSEVDEALENFDREARCVDDKVFATREEAAKQRKISEFEAGLDVSTEDESLKSKRKLQKLIADLGVDGSWKLSRIDKALAKFEKDACTVGGREFSTRGEAAKQRELVAAEADIDLSSEESALAAKKELEALISSLGIDGEWKLERVKKALNVFDELARTAFGVIYKTRDEAVVARSSRQAFFAALEQAVKDARDEKFYLKDEIPEKKLTGAMTYLSSENCDGVFALLDTTFFGSAKLGLVATRVGIVWKNEYLETRRNSYSWRELGAITGELSLKKDTEIWFEDGVAYEDSGSDAVHEEVFKVLCKFKRYSSEATFWDTPEIEPNAAKEKREDRTGAKTVQSIFKGFAALELDEVFVGDKIPEKKRMNAFTSMRVKEPMSSVAVLVDATVWGSAKDGLVITDKALYFKNMMEDPIRIKLSDIKKVKVDEKDILFNGQRFSLGVFDEKAIAAIAKCFRTK